MRFLSLFSVVFASRNDLSPKSIRKLLQQTVKFYVSEQQPRKDEALIFEDSLDILLETLCKTPPTPSQYRLLFFTANFCMRRWCVLKKGYKIGLIMRLFFLIGLTTLLASDQLPPFSPGYGEFDDFFDISLDCIFDEPVAGPVEEPQVREVASVEEDEEWQESDDDSRKSRKKRKKSIRRASKYTDSQHALIRELASQRFSRHRSELFAEACDIWEKENAAPMLEESFYRFLNYCNRPRGSLESGGRIKKIKRKRYCRKKPASTADEASDASNI